MDDSFILTDDDTIKSVLAQYHQAWASADEIASASWLLVAHRPEPFREGPIG